MFVEWPQNAIRQLNDKIPELFKRLKIMVKSLRDWTEGDVIANGGVLLSVNNIPREIAEIINRLKQKRTYRVSAMFTTSFLFELRSHYRRTVLVSYVLPESTPQSLPRCSPRSLVAIPW